MVGVRLPTPVVGGVPEYRLGYPRIVPLNTSGVEALTTASGRMFQSRTVRGKNKGDSYMMTVGCGKREFSTRVGTGCNLISKGIEFATKP